jgi:hypothetical protein
LLPRPHRVLARLRRHAALPVESKDCVRHLRVVSGSVDGRIVTALGDTRRGAALAAPVPAPSPAACRTTRGRGLPPSALPGPAATNARQASGAALPRLELAATGYRKGDRRRRQRRQLPEEGQAAAIPPQWASTKSAGRKRCPDPLVAAAHPPFSSVRRARPRRNRFGELAVRECVFDRLRRADPSHSLR